MDRFEPITLFLCVRQNCFYVGNRVIFPQNQCSLRVSIMTMATLSCQSRRSSVVTLSTNSTSFLRKTSIVFQRLYLRSNENWRRRHRIALPPVRNGIRYKGPQLTKTDGHVLYCCFDKKWVRGSTFASHSSKMEFVTFRTADQSFSVRSIVCTKSVLLPAGLSHLHMQHFLRQPNVVSAGIQYT